MSVGLWSGSASADEGPRRWEKAIQQFEKQDKVQAPPENAVLFLGSSSIRLWKLPSFFGDLPAINRGFGGSQISDSIHFAKRVALKYKPRIIVFYAGDNDVNNKKSPDTVFGDFQTFAAIVHKALPKTRLIFIAIKPSLKRWDLYPKMRAANLKIRAYCEKHAHLQYADIAAPMLGKDGKPRPELFAKDGLHLNDKGYKVWTAVVKPLLKK